MGHGLVPLGRFGRPGGWYWMVDPAGTADFRSGEAGGQWGGLGGHLGYDLVPLGHFEIDGHGRPGGSYWLVDPAGAADFHLGEAGGRWGGLGGCGLLLLRVHDGGARAGSRLHLLDPIQVQTPYHSQIRSAIRVHGRPRHDYSSFSSHC